MQHLQRKIGSLATTEDCTCAPTYERACKSWPRCSGPALRIIAEAARAVPHGVICLLSALRFHELTTQLPHQVWMLIGHKKWAPKNPPISLRIIRATGDALTAGVERHLIEQVEVPITNPAKTVADCFKYRSQVGLDVANRVVPTVPAHKGAVGSDEELPRARGDGAA